MAQKNSSKLSPKEANKLLWKIHHWTGLYSGIVIGVLCLTGALAVFIPEIDYLIQKLYYRASSTPTKEWHIDHSLVQLKQHYPGYQSLRIEFPEKTDQAGIIHIAWKEKGEKEIQRFSFFTDMGRDKLLSSRNQQNSVANYLRQIHVRLYEGNWGRYLVGLAGLCFVIVTITGLMIYGKFMKKQRFPEVRKKGLRILLADWHKLLGIATLAFNLVIAITGTWLGWQGLFKVKNPAQYKAPIVISKKADLNMDIPWKEAFSIVHNNFPDLAIRYATSSDDGSATVSFFGNVKGKIYERDINKLILSKMDLKPLFRYDVREKPIAHKFYFIQEAIHFGDYGGLTLKILYATLGLIASFLAISGFIIYFFRTERKTKRKSNPLKITFVYCIIILLLLLGIALTSTLIGYSTASYIMAILIDGGLIGLLFFSLSRYLYQKFRKKRVSAT